MEPACCSSRCASTSKNPNRSKQWKRDRLGDPFPFAEQPFVAAADCAGSHLEWVALDKEKGFVKGENILSGAEHRLLLTSESVGPRLWDITAESLFWWIAPPNHGYDQKLLS